MTQKREEEREAKREAKREAREEREAARAADEAQAAEPFADRPEGKPTSSGGKAWRPGDPEPSPPPDEIEQPQAEPKDATREGAGAWSSPPPGQKVPAQAGGGGGVASPEGKVPRVIDQGERAPEGLRRFKVRADIPGEPTPTLYILAKDEESACKHYMEYTGRQKRLDHLKRQGQEAQAPFLSVRELPD